MSGKVSPSLNQMTLPLSMSPGVSVIYHGDALSVLKKLPGNSVQMAVTSPPYWGLRDYGTPDQLGSETTLDEYILNYERLVNAQSEYLLPALLDQINRIEIHQLDQELHTLVGEEKLRN